MKSWKLNKKPRPNINDRRTEAYRAQRQCYRKVKFHNTETAYQRVAEIVNEGGPRLYVYSCGSCGQHHLTKQESAEGQLIKTN